MKSLQNQRSNLERKWQLDQLRQDKSLGNWIERKYHLTSNQLNQLFKDGYIRIKNNEPVSVNQMVNYYQQEQNLKDRVRELDTSSIDNNDLISKINDRTKPLKATSIINQKEHLKSLMGLALVELGLVLTIGLGKKIFKDSSDEILRQKKLSPKKIKKPVWTSEWVKSKIYENTKNQNFSDAIWSDIDQLKARLDSVLVRSIAHGTSNQETARKFDDLVKKEIGNQAYVTQRVARTESAKIEFQIQKQMAKQQGFKYVQWHAEPGACRACRNISEDSPTKFGQGIYKVDTVPIIPVHPNCRCSVSSFFTDEV